MFEKVVSTEPGETPVGRLIGWCLGPWNGGRFRKIIGWLSAGYLLFVCVAIWCPRVRGVVVDARTGRPVPDAQILVRPAGFFMLAVEAGNEALEGKTLSARTSSTGRFSVPGSAVRPWPWEAGALNVFSPLQWITHVQIAVWAPGYGTKVIEIPSYAVVPWWRKSGDREGWNVSRLRLPVWGFWVHMALRKPEGEKEWRRVCGQAVTAHAEGIIPDEWLFNDLTGYLERWPQGEMAGEYYKLLWETANLAPCNPYEREDFLRGVVTRERLQTYCDRAAKIIALSEMLEKPPAGLAKDEFRWKVEEEKKQLVCAKELLALTDRTRNGSKELGQVFNVSVLNASLLSMVHFMP